MISPLTIVSIPNSMSLDTNLIPASEASITKHSRIVMVDFDDTALRAILTPFNKSDFRHLIFIIVYNSLHTFFNIYIIKT